MTTNSKNKSSKLGPVVHFRFRKKSPWVVCGRRLSQRMHWSAKELETSCIPCLRQMHAVLAYPETALRAPTLKGIQKARAALQKLLHRQTEAERLVKQHRRRGQTPQR